MRAMIITIWDNLNIVILKCIKIKVFKLMNSLRSYIHDVCAWILTSLRINIIWRMAIPTKPKGILSKYIYKNVKTQITFMETSNVKLIHRYQIFWIRCSLTYTHLKKIFHLLQKTSKKNRQFWKISYVASSSWSWIAI